SCYAKKSPALLAGVKRAETFHGGGCEGELRKKAFRAKANRIAANRFRPPEKKTPPPQGGSRAPSDTPAPLSTGSARPKGLLKGRRSLLRCRPSSVTSNATTVCPIPDSLIRLSLHAPRGRFHPLIAPRPAPAGSTRSNSTASA